MLVAEKVVEEAQYVFKAVANLNVVGGVVKERATRNKPGSGESST